MKLREAQSEFVKNMGLLISFAYEKGFQFTAGELYRTDYQQKEYVRTGVSKTLNSRHLVRLAVDFNIFKDGRMLFSDKTIYAQDLQLVKQLGDFWESLNKDNVWGGDWDRNNVLDEKFKDPYHFEMKPPTE